MPFPLVHPERADVHPKLQACAVYVAAHCDFWVGVPLNGGTRTDPALQAQIAAEGNSNASSLDDTPHGCGCGLDLAVYSFADHDYHWPGGPSGDGGIPDLAAKYEQIADLVEEFGMVSGRNFTLPDGSHDTGHAELPDWRAVRDAWRSTVGVDPSAGGTAIVVALGLGAVGLVGLLLWTVLA